MPCLRIVLAAAVFGALAVGCSRDSLGRRAISGTVKVDGIPLAKGHISFQPTEGQPTSSGAVISGGKFSIPPETGLVAGKYRVSINAPVPGTGEKVEQNVIPGEPTPPPKELIPREWNDASEHFIDVRKTGPFEFSLDVTAKEK